jgi:hypothetical protein
MDAWGRTQHAWSMDEENTHCCEVDWAVVLDELASSLGVSFRALSEAIDIPRVTMIDWRKGASPRHKDGERVIATWCRLTGKERSDLPHRAMSGSRHRPLPYTAAHPTQGAPTHVQHQEARADAGCCPG